MAVVVEQTIPFSSESLDLQNSNRWNTLIPLLRPTIKSFKTLKGQTILLDTAKSSNKENIHIIAISTAGDFSSKLLDDKQLTGIVIEQPGTKFEDVSDLPKVLETAGFATENGIVVVRAGQRTSKSLNTHSPGLLEVESAGELEQNHIIHLLGTATKETSTSPEQTSELLKIFQRGVSQAHGTFHAEKVNGKPAVLHADGPRGFDRARDTVGEAVRSAMKALAAQGEDVVHSVHFSDVNGLSRLENYIVAGEIAQFLDSQKVKYALSHSTILNHANQARGFSISICPIPTRFLAPTAIPISHTPTTTTATSPPGSSTPSNPTTSGRSYPIPFSDAPIRRRITAACSAVIAAESTITSYDTIVGDGDCGYTLRDGAQKVQDFIRSRDLSQLPAVLGELVAELEISMGGTSGALYCIFLTALAGALARENSVHAALQVALGELCVYTNARVGDRTMMDALIPFVEGLAGSGGEGVSEAVQRAREGVEGTKRMEAKLGRSTYLDESATQGVPDPGAYGLLVLLEGMVE